MSGIDDTFTWNAPDGPIVVDSPVQPPDAPLAGVNGSGALNNHGYPPNHNHGTHASGVPSTTDTMPSTAPTSYGDDTTGQG